MFNISDTLLQRGIDYTTQNGIKIHHPTLNEIDEFGEKNYMFAMSIFASTSYDYMVELDDMNIDFVDISNYDLFLSLYSTDEAKYACSIFLKNYNFQHMYNTITEETVLYDEESGILIDRLIYEEISTFIKRINMIPLNPPHDINNLRDKPFLKNMILEDMRAKKERAKYRNNIQKQSELSNNIRFIVWNNTVGYNYNNIWDLKIYHLYEGIISLQKTDNYKNTMLGLYTGNVDGKKVNLESISWLSQIKIN